MPILMDAQKYQEHVDSVRRALQAFDIGPEDCWSAYLSGEGEVHREERVFIPRLGQHEQYLDIGSTATSWKNMDEKTRVNAIIDSTLIGWGLSYWRTLGMPVAVEVRGGPRRYAVMTWYVADLDEKRFI